MTAHADVLIVLDAVESLDIEAIANLPIEDALRCVDALEESHRVLALVRSALPGALAPIFGEKQITVEGTGTFVLHGKRDRKQWDRDALLSAVLDSRLVDTETGEVADETPLQKVLACWNLPAPRTTALKARGIDADQFCRSEWGGHTIEIIK